MEGRNQKEEAHQLSCAPGTSATQNQDIGEGNQNDKMTRIEQNELVLQDKLVLRITTFVYISLHVRNKHVKIVDSSTVKPRSS